MAETWLVAILAPELALAALERDPGAEFRADGARYLDAAGTDFIAFYDRLEDDGGTLVGVRVWPLRNTEALLLGGLAERPYLRSPGGLDCLDLLFRPGVENASSTEDQAFGGRVYTDGTGRYALSPSTWHTWRSLHGTWRPSGLRRCDGWTSREGGRWMIHLGAS